MLEETLQRCPLPAEAPLMHKYDQALLNEAGDESGIREIKWGDGETAPRESQQTTRVLVQGPTWYELFEDPSGGPTGVLEFESVDGEPALELQVWLHPDEGRSTFIWFDEDGEMLEIVKSISA